MSDRIEAEILDVLGEEVAAAVDTPLVVIEGPKGDPGAPGKDGNPGAPGKDGAPGVYYGTTQPTGDTHPVWIDPGGDHDDGGLLPAVTDADNGKVLRVVNGAWAAADMPSGGGSIDVSVEPADDDIPKVYFTGTLPTNKGEGELRLTMRYVSKSADFTYPVTLKVQGSSSVSYPKKNFTLKPYKDSTYESKKKLAFKNWPEMNKFVLKAHWIDHSHVRNVGTAKIWSKIVKSRSDYDSMPEELRNAPNNGATDGFTVKVFANGVYQGLYEWIVAKDKLFGQDSNIATHSILNSEANNTETCVFATTSPSVAGNWSEELHDVMSSDISTSFANLIKFVAGSTDEEFVANAENYFDVQSVIDFDIFARVFCIVDNIGKNQIFFTYDGVKWYEGCWDVDAVLGAHPTAGAFLPYDTEFQTGYVAYASHGLTNVLYQRIETLFFDRFKQRYEELRSGVLSIDNIIEVYERLTDTILLFGDLLKEDYAETTGGGAFTGIPYRNENNIQQIRNFIAARIPYMDEQIKAMMPPVPCTGISLSASSLAFTEGGSKTLTATVTPDGCTDVITWASDNTSIATVSGGVVTAVANGNCTITATCGGYSATCSVSVTGIVESIPCTGISLSAETLTFDGEGTQTITATVTPSDTTDSVVWVSSNQAVASISAEGNVCTVQSVGNGDTTITATCGKYSASCGVNVSINVLNIIEGATWNAGYIDGSGTIQSAANDIYSDPIDISEYIGMRFVASMGGANNRFAFYDDSNVKVEVYTTASYTGITIPEGAKYLRISLSPHYRDNPLLLYTYEENLFDSADFETGSYSGSGYNPNDSGSKHIKMAVTAGESIMCAGFWGLTFVDSSGAVLSHTQDNSTGAIASIAPDNAVKAMFSSTNANTAKLITKRYTEVGRAATA